MLQLGLDFGLDFIRRILKLDGKPLVKQLRLKGYPP